MAITVDALELTVKTSADSAATSVSSLTQALEGLKGKYGSISALARSVTALKESAKGGMRLSSAATQIQNFGETVSRSINQSRIGKLNDLARAIKKLKTASSDFRMPGLSAIEGIRNAAKQGSATINNSQNNYKSAASAGAITEAVRKEASATKAETAAIKEQAHAVDELASRKAEWIAYQQEKHYRTGGKEGSIRPVWSKEAEAADPVRPVKEIYNGDKKPDPIDLPESMYDALEMKAKGLGEVAEAAADAGNKLKTANATISGLKTTNEMEKMADGDKLRESLGSYQDLIGKTKEELLQLGIVAAETKAKLAFETGNLDQMISAANGYQKARDALENYRTAQQNLIKEQQAGQALIAQLKADGASDAMVSFAESQLKAGTSANTLRNRLYDLDGELKKKPGDVTDARTSFETFRDALKNMGPSIKQYIKNHTKLLQQFGRVAKMRAMRYAIRAVTQGLKEGIGNLYQWSKQMKGSFADSMDAAASSLLLLKNSLATAVAPLLQSLVPVLQQVVGWVREGCNWLSMFFARLNGASSWTRAKDVVTEYAAATKDANKNTKELLASFDELNVITSESNSGNSVKATEIKDMFEDVPLDENSSAVKWADSVKPILDWMQAHPWVTAAGAGAVFIGWKAFLKPWLKNIFSGGSKATKAAEAAAKAAEAAQKAAEEAKQAVEEATKAKTESNQTTQEKTQVQQEAKEAQKEVQQAKEETSNAKKEALEAKQEQAKLQQEVNHAKMEQSQAQQEARITANELPKLEAGTGYTSSSFVMPFGSSYTPALTAGSTINLGSGTQLNLTAGEGIEIGDGLRIGTEEGYNPNRVDYGNSFWKNLKEKVQDFIIDESGSAKISDNLKNSLNKTALDVGAYANSFNITNDSFVADWAAHNTTYGAGLTNLLGNAYAKVASLVTGNDYTYTPQTKYKDVEQNGTTLFNDALLTTFLAGKGLTTLPSLMIADSAAGAAIGVKPSQLLASVAEKVSEEGFGVLGKVGADNPFNQAWFDLKYGNNGGKPAYTTIEERAAEVEESLKSLRYEVLEFGKETESVSGKLQNMIKTKQVNEITSRLNKMGVSFKGMAKVISDTKIIAPIIDSVGFENSAQVIHDTAVLFGDETETVIRNWNFIAPYVNEANYGTSLSHIYNIARETGADTATIMQNWKFIAPMIDKYGYDKSMNMIKTLATATGTSTEYIIDRWEYIAPGIDKSTFAASVSALTYFSQESGHMLNVAINNWDLIAPYIDETNPRESARNISNLIKRYGEDWETILKQQKLFTNDIEPSGNFFTDVYTQIDTGLGNAKDKLKNAVLMLNKILVPDSNIPGQVDKQAQAGQQEAKSSKNLITFATTVKKITSGDISGALADAQKYLSNSPLKAYVNVIANAQNAVNTVKNAFSNMFGGGGFTGVATSNDVTKVNNNVNSTRSTLKTHMTDIGLDIVDALKGVAETSYETKWNSDGTVDIAPCLAGGAFSIPSGQLFIAREQGPELVGKIGSHNSVANNDQIVNGIASGVARVMAPVEQRLARIEQYAGITASKDTTVKITPSAALGRVNAQSAAMYDRAGGR